jgi:ribosomal protein S18 acetylase RimI-like enzyme
MLIRPHHEADRETLKRITIEAFEGVSIEQNIEQRFGTIAGRDWRSRKARHIDEDFDAPGAAIWVAEEENGEVLGYITTRMDRVASVGLIPNLAVRAGLRGQGIGRQLIEHALERFREAGLEVARIETLEQNPIGRHLYPACGFVEVARQIHFAVRLRP